jgi:hypothetical protein
LETVDALREIVDDPMILGFDRAEWRGKDGTDG